MHTGTCSASGRHLRIRCKSASSVHPAPVCTAPASRLSCCILVSAGALVVPTCSVGLDRTTGIGGCFLQFPDLVKPRARLCRIMCSTWIGCSGCGAPPGGCFRSAVVSGAVSAPPAAGPVAWAAAPSGTGAEAWAGGAASPPSSQWHIDGCRLHRAHHACRGLPCESEPPLPSTTSSSVASRLTPLVSSRAVGSSVRPAYRSRWLAAGMPSLRSINSWTCATVAASVVSNTSVCPRTVRTKSCTPSASSPP